PTSRTSSPPPRPAGTPPPLRRHRNAPTGAGMRMRDLAWKIGASRNFGGRFCTLEFHLAPNFHANPILAPPNSGMAHWRGWAATFFFAAGLGVVAGVGGVIGPGGGRVYATRPPPTLRD